MATIATQVLLFVLRIGGTAILARLLSPDDYGLFAMVTIVVAFADMFKDAGLSMATVQKRKISKEQIGTLFWYNTAIGSILGFLVLTCAPVVAWFFEKPDLLGLTAACAALFFIQGLSVQHLAMQRRHMRFGTVSIIQLVAQITGTGITIILAFHQFKSWALVVGTLSSSVLTTIMAFCFFPWFPQRPRGGREIREMLRFGGNLTGFQVINYFARNADNILIGKALGSVALGLYGRAYSLLMLPINMISGPLSEVAITALSRLQDNREKLFQNYLRILYLLGLVTCPLSGAALVLSDELVLLLLGANWQPAALVFRFLAIGGLLQPLYNAYPWLLLACGRSDRLFTWGLVTTPVFISSFLIGINWGINGVAFCYSIAVIMITGASFRVAGHTVGLLPARIFLSVYRPVVSCAAAVVCLLAIDGIFAELSVLTSLFVKGSCFLILYALALMATHNGVRPLYEVFSTWKNLIRVPKEKPHA